MAHFYYSITVRPKWAQGQRIRWHDGQGNYPLTAKALGYRTPFGWDRTVEAVLAHHVTTHKALTKAAHEIYARAKARMAAHRDTGAARVGIEAGDHLDWYIYLEDTEFRSVDAQGRMWQGPLKNGGRRSALSIEFGHRVRGSGKRVGGLYIITGAVNSLAGGWFKRWDT